MSKKTIISKHVCDEKLCSNASIAAVGILNPKNSSTNKLVQGTPLHLVLHIDQLLTSVDVAVASFPLIVIHTTVDLLAYHPVLPLEVPVVVVLPLVVIHPIVACQFLFQSIIPSIGVSKSCKKYHESILDEEWTQNLLHKLEMASLSTAALPPYYSIV